MFTKEFNHSTQDIKKACGFDDEDYLNSLVEAFLKIYNESRRYSGFVESAEKQIIGTIDVPDSIRIGIRILLIMIIPQLKALAQAKSVRSARQEELSSLRDPLKDLVKESMKDVDISSVAKELDDFKEFMLKELEKAKDV
jgi:hypothetical protein